MFAQIRQLLQLIRFSHTLFALPFALLAAGMAWAAGAVAAPPLAWRWQDLLGILLCMVTARSVAMAVNRIADRDIDARNPRTETRHLATGAVSLRSVVFLAFASGLLFLASTLLFLPGNPLPLYLSLPVLAFLVGYSYSKRFTSLSHFWLGAALMLAPISAWIAIRGAIVMQNPADLLPAVILGGGVLLWVAGFDIIYACQDAEFDREAGLQSVPGRIGVGPALRVAAGCHVGTVILLALLPAVFPQLGWIYWCGVAAIGLLLLYEHLLVRPDDLTRVNVAFFQVNAVISIGLFLVGTLDLLI